jgi:triosephosphate isomerase (TIM)
VSARTPVLGGNWKMHLARGDAEALLARLRADLDGLRGVEVVIFPPAPWLPLAADAFAGSPLQVGVQNVYWEPAGAFTGEVSPTLLRDTATWALVGHSERRHLFHESDADTKHKLRAVIEAGLHPILAVGELERERDAGHTQQVLERQLLAAFEGLPRLDPGFVIAYEPVWAIGTGRAATPAIAAEACTQIRDVVSARFGEAAAEACRVQYGGSVSPENVAGFAAAPGVDGALVGGASLDAEKFAAICRAFAAARTP